MRGPLDPAPDPANMSMKKSLIIAAVILAMVIGGVALANSNSTSSSHATVPTRSTLRHVIYEVEGTTTQASLTFETATGGSSQQQDVDVPVTKKKDHTRGIEGDFQPGAFLYISAQNSKDSGTVICRITVDGIVIAENTSSGAYAIASCSGSA